MTPVPGDEICFEDKASLSSLRALLNKWNPCWKHQEMCRWWTTCALCNDSFFFFSFSKKCWDLAELYTAGRRHGFTHGRILPEQAACCQPHDSLFTAGNNHCVEEHEWWGLGPEEGYLKWWIPEEEPFWIKTIQSQNTHWMGRLGATTTDLST